MIYRGYPERDLVVNRSSLILHGSTEAERRAWADEAAANFAGEGVLLRVATNAADLKTALGVPRGVVYVPDVSAIDDLAQGEVVRLLREREERPKIIIGVTGDPARARDTGKLRSDLQYALQMAVVNLDEPGLKEAIAKRRARAPKRPAASSSASSSSAPARPAASKGRRAPPRAAAPRAARRAPAAAAKKKAARPAAKKSASPRRRR